MISALQSFSYQPVYLLVWISLCFLWSCLPTETGDWRFACRSHLDCPQTPVPLQCLPLYEGETLEAYCQQASCPTKSGFEAFTTLHQMPKVCDSDQNQDGLADLQGFRTLKPLPIEELGIMETQCQCTSIEECDFTQCTPPAGYFGIFQLFTPSCSDSLLYVDELRLCLPHLISSSFCAHQDECSPSSYCSSLSLQCEDRKESGERCEQNQECLSQSCVRNQCIQGLPGEFCTTDLDCKDGLVCTGQRTLSPQAPATFGQKVCSTLMEELSACDPYLMPCPSSLICSEEIECSEFDLERQSYCEEQVFKTRFLCIPN